MTKENSEFIDMEEEDFDIIDNSKKNEESESESELELEEVDPVYAILALAGLGIGIYSFSYVLNNYFIQKNNEEERMARGIRILNNMNGNGEDKYPGFDWLKYPHTFNTGDLSPIVIHEDSPPEIQEDEKLVTTSPGQIRGRRYETIYQTQYNPGQAPILESRNVINDEHERYIDELELKKRNNQYKNRLNKKREMLGNFGRKTSLTDVIEDNTVYGVDAVDEEDNEEIEFIPSDDLVY